MVFFIRDLASYTFTLRKGRHVFFFIPILLGIIGIAFHKNNNNNYDNRSLKIHLISTEYEKGETVNEQISQINKKSRISLIV